MGQALLDGGIEIVLLPGVRVVYRAALPILIQRMSA